MENVENPPPPFGDLIIPGIPNRGQSVLSTVEMDVCDYDPWENTVVYFFVQANKFSIGTGSPGSSGAPRISMKSLL